MLSWLWFRVAHETGVTAVLVDNCWDSIQMEHLLVRMLDDLDCYLEGKDPDKVWWFVFCDAPTSTFLSKRAFFVRDLHGPHTEMC